MVFISDEEKWFAITLIFDLMMKNGYFPNYSEYCILIYTGILVYGVYEGSIRFHIPLVYLIIMGNFYLIHLTKGDYWMDWVTSMISALAAFLLINL